MLFRTYHGFMAQTNLVSPHRVEVVVGEQAEATSHCRCSTTRPSGTPCMDCRERLRSLPSKVKAGSANFPLADGISGLHLKLARLEQLGASDTFLHNWQHGLAACPALTCQNHSSISALKDWADWDRL